MALIIYCADIGSVRRGNFGWARLEVDASISACNTSCDIQSFADTIAADIMAQKATPDLTPIRPEEGRHL